MNYFLKTYQLEILHGAYGQSVDILYKIWWPYYLIYSSRLKNLTGHDYLTKFISSKLSS